MVTRDDSAPGELYLIADVEAARQYGVNLVDVVRGFLGAGGRMVSLRGSSTGDRELMDLGRVIAGLVSSVRGLFLVHHRVDLALLLSADGVHLSSQGLGAYQVRRLMGPSAVVGRSCHSGIDILEHHQESTFLTLGPLFPSLSKEGYGPEMTLREFKEIASGLRRLGSTKLYALGGVKPENTATALLAGAHGIALIGGIVGAPDPGEATGDYLEALRSAERGF